MTKRKLMQEKNGQTDPPMSDVEKQLYIYQSILKNENGVAGTESIAALSNPITFVWDEVQCGDCVLLKGSSATFYPSGVMLWAGTTLTNHTHFGDHWHIGVSCFDKDKKQIILIGPVSGPDMNDGNPPPPYRWTFSATFDPNLFDAIVSCQSWNAC